MIRFFEKQDKEEIIKLAGDFLGDMFRREIFSRHFDEIIAGEGILTGISVLHAGEYLGYCVAEKGNKTITVRQLYIKPAFQNLKVAPQVLDFIKDNFADYKYRVIIPAGFEAAGKVFTKHGFEII